MAAPRKLDYRIWLAIVVLVVLAKYFAPQWFAPAGGPDHAEVPRQVEDADDAKPAVDVPPSRTNVPSPRKDDASSRKDDPPSRETPSVREETSAADPLLIRNLTLRDQDRKTIYRGDINLRPTLQRIEAGKRLRFSHDGTTFQNRERRLPRKDGNYYTEWVVPTPGENGPGPQRLVIGADGDVWYTADHYASFRRISYTLRPAHE